MNDFFLFGRKDDICNLLLGFIYMYFKDLFYIVKNVDIIYLIIVRIELSN